MSEKEMNFEEASKKLDKIIAEFEQDNVPLDKAVKMFEEAEKLLKICSNTLSQAKGKILVIKDNIAKEFETQSN